ncbi:MAG TPA: flagellin [Steroidobacteraceae bacterium]|jgi:flagellin|nr:flagellin [Steroidobacteraceae bacterium]
MSLVLNTNVDALVAQNALTSSGNSLATSLQQLSTGLRINTPADDAAGYAIVQGMTSQINGMNQAQQNANDGVSLAQTASGALTEITNDLQSMRDLAVESLNATNSSSDRTDLDQQFQQLMADINNVAQTTSFNGVNLLDGTFQGATFQVGANAGQTISVSSVASAQADNLGTVYTGQVSGSGGDTVTLATGGTYGVAAAGTTGAYTAGSGGVATDFAQSSIEGDSVTLQVKVNGTEYTTGAIALTGTASADLKSIASGINQAVSSVGGIVATVNSGNTGITFSATTGANQGDIIESSVTAATDSNGNALTVADGTQAAVDLGIDSADTIGTYTNAGATAITATNTLSTLDVNTVDDSNLALISIDAALQQVAATGAQIGAYQNRFQAAASGLATDMTNLSSARSNVQDTDYALATSQLSQAQILQQASTAMVAQANTIPQNVLTLLQKLP